MSETSRLQKLQAQRDALDARIQQLQAREREAARKLDTRRKIIVGGAILAAMADNPELARRVKAELRQRVTRAADLSALGGLLDGTAPKA